MTIIKNRPIPKGHVGARRIPNDPADLMVSGDSVAFDNFKEAISLSGRLKWRGKKATVRSTVPNKEWVVWCLGCLYE